MNISLKWLKQYLDFDLTAQEVGDALTSLGLEVGAVEEVETIRGGLKGLVVGKVLTCEPHPNSDHLHLTTVDLGNGEEPDQYQAAILVPGYELDVRGKAIDGIRFYLRSTEYMSDLSVWLHIP